MKLFFNEKEAAEILCVSRFTLQKWRQKGIGPKFTKYNGRILYLFSDIAAIHNSAMQGGK